jgi:hypothetical protein
MENGSLRIIIYLISMVIYHQIPSAAPPSMTSMAIQMPTDAQLTLCGIRSATPVGAQLAPVGEAEGLSRFQVPKPHRDIWMRCR